MTTKQFIGGRAPDGSQYVTITDGAGNLGESGSSVIGAVTQSGTWTVQPGNTANTTAWKVDGSAVTQPVSMVAPTTGTITSVASSASDVTILASNASRKGATIYNDSTQILYLALSNVTSSSTVYTIQLAAGTYYELPVTQYGRYTGVIKGIWASANGNARITEFT